MSGSPTLLGTIFDRLVVTSFSIFLQEGLIIIQKEPPKWWQRLPRILLMAEILHHLACTKLVENNGMI